MLNQGSALHFHPTLSHKLLLAARSGNCPAKVWKEEIERTSLVTFDAAHRTE